MLVQQLQTVTKEYYCSITIYILVLAAEFLTGSKEYSAVVGIHKAVAQESGAESPKIKPGHKL